MATNNKKNNNILAFNRPINLNIGLIFFAIILIYIVICVFMYFSSKHIMGYEVKTGSLSVTNVFEGIALRDETVVKANNAGYVNYFAIEGEKVGAGNAVCAIDETGQLQDYFNKNDSESNILTSRDLSELTNDMVNFSSGFNNKNFSEVYDFKYAIQSNVVKFSNRNIMNSINDISSTSNLMNICNSPSSGVVQYFIDGFEESNPYQVDESWFEQEKYEKKQLVNNDIVASGDPIYKLSNNENWSIIIPVDEKRAEELVEEKYVKVKFLKNQYESWGKVDRIDGQDGNCYINLSFTNSMITFVMDRFINIELITKVETGLKVPNSSIVEREFFLIPEKFVITGNNEDYYVLKETYNENGEMIPTKTQISVYNNEDGEFYVDAAAMKLGDRLDEPDSSNTIAVSKSATLMGVYNINKGYADFKQIQILNSNEEYSIVKSNTSYGLVAYDYIVLDSDSVETDELIYE